MSGIRIVLAGVLFSLAVVLALAQTDIQCNDTGITGDCTQFITNFCADVATVKVEGYKDISRCYKASGFTCELTAYNTHDAAENPSKVNCGKVLTKVSQSCLQGGEAKFTASAQFNFTIDPDEKERCSRST